MRARDLRPARSRREGPAAHAPHRRVTARHQTTGTGAHGSTRAHPSAKGPRFFSPAQAHVAESARCASVATNIPLRSATIPSYGMAQQVEPEKTSKDAWSQQTASRSASTGSFQKAADRPATWIGTDAPAAGRPIMGPKDALEQRSLEPLTPYAKEAWAELLSECKLVGRYPLLVQSLASGFDLGIPRIVQTYIPPNHPSAASLPDVYSSIIDSEFKAGRYIGPFTRGQLEKALGPFQTSPLSLVPKTSKLGVYRAVHDFSHPHNPSPDTSSVNSHIDGDAFPCTWGTFSTVALLIARLPPGSQASIRDVAEAYRTIPVAPAQWPGLVVRLQAEDQFAVNTCNNFGLSSAGGVYGSLADAGADIFRSKGMGPLAKWVDDHVFFRVHRTHLPRYNAQRAEWCREIQAHEGRMQKGGRLWYGGKALPSGPTEEFDEDCSAPLQDLAESSHRSPQDHDFAYADADIDKLSARLGIKWQASKSVPFGEEVPYLGFRWNLRSRKVYLPDEKKAKYLAAIAEWGGRRTHNLLEVQRLHGKLLHAALVIPAGRAHLTNLEAMLASFSGSPFVPHTPPRDTPDDLAWWQRQLGRAIIFAPIDEPQPLIEHSAYSDASSGVGVAITIGARWRAWKLVPGWKSQGRDIQWAEAVGFELLVISLCELSHEGDHIVVYGDNRGVVEGWWKKCSGNRPTNLIFRRVIRFSEDHRRTIHTRYVPSAQNPADPPSRGIYPPRSLLLHPIVVPTEARSLLVDV